MLKSSLADLLPVTHPSLALSLKFPTLQLSLPPPIFHKLTKIGNCFIESDTEEIHEKAATEKTQVMSNAKKIGELYKRGRGVHVWNKYFAVLSGNYIYLFENKKDKDYKEYFRVKNSVLEERGEEFGMKNAFSVEI
jgi:hypothetical protein